MPVRVEAIGGAVFGPAVAAQLDVRARRGRAGGAGSSRSASASAAADVPARYGSTSATSRRPSGRADGCVERPDGRRVGDGRRRGRRSRQARVEHRADSEDERAAGDPRAATVSCSNGRRVGIRLLGQAGSRRARRRRRARSSALEPHRGGPGRGSCSRAASTSRATSPGDWCVRPRGARRRRADADQHGADAWCPRSSLICSNGRSTRNGA